MVRRCGFRYAPTLLALLVGGGVALSSAAIADDASKSAAGFFPKEAGFFPKGFVFDDDFSHGGSSGGDDTPNEGEEQPGSGAVIGTDRDWHLGKEVLVDAPGAETVTAYDTELTTVLAPQGGGMDAEGNPKAWAGTYGKDHKGLNVSKFNPVPEGALDAAGTGGSIANAVQAATGDQSSEQVDPSLMTWSVFSGKGIDDLSKNTYPDIKPPSKDDGEGDSDDDGTNPDIGGDDSVIPDTGNGNDTTGSNNGNDNPFGFGNPGEDPSQNNGQANNNNPCGFWGCGSDGAAGGSNPNNSNNNPGSSNPGGSTPGEFVQPNPDNPGGIPGNESDYSGPGDSFNDAVRVPPTGSDDLVNLNPNPGTGPGGGVIIPPGTGGNESATSRQPQIDPTPTPGATPTPQPASGRPNVGNGGVIVFADAMTETAATEGQEGQAPAEQPAQETQQIQKAEAPADNRNLFQRILADLL